MPRHHVNQHSHRPNRAARTGLDRSRRVLGQNFLRDERTIRQIVRAAAVGPADLVLEVGAGRGALTRPLARVCGRLVAYEIDADLAGQLAREFATTERVRVVPGDFVAARPPAEPFVVVGNIPYASTTRIVEWCLAAPTLRTATLVTQLEYARKRCGDYHRWTLRTVQTWPRFHWRLAGRIPRERFRPRPRVDSGILQLARRPVDLLPADLLPDYARFVELGFRGLGGSLRTSLHRGYPARRVDAALRAHRISPAALPGEIWPEQWIALFLAVRHDARR